MPFFAGAPSRLHAGADAVPSTEMNAPHIPNSPAASAISPVEDIVAELRAESLEAFDRVLARIRLVEGISSTETSLLLSTHKL